MRQSQRTVLPCQGTTPYVLSGACWMRKYEDDELDGEGEDWDDEGELEFAGDSVDDGDNIIIVGEDDKDDRNGVSRKAKTLKAEKIAR